MRNVLILSDANFHKLFLPQNRSPDENLIIGWNEVYEGVDVYSLGNQFYKLLMNDAKHKGLSTSGCLKAIREGDIPILPDSYEQSTDPIDIALIHVMKRSLQFDPKDSFLFLFRGIISFTYGHIKHLIN